MNKKIKTEAVDHLFDAILTLKDPEECYKFFEDVCTINELLSLSQRYEVAKMLREGKTYLEIAASWRREKRRAVKRKCIGDEKSLAGYVCCRTLFKWAKR